MRKKINSKGSVRKFSSKSKFKEEFDEIKSKPAPVKPGKFHLEFKNGAQKLAYASFQQNDVLFLNGPAGVGKTFLAMSFAISEILQGNKKKIILTRPVVEAGENLGFLPGTLEEKLAPYMLPLQDSLFKLVGSNNAQRDLIDSCIEVAPIAFMRGRTFSNSVCIFDEAQNATMSQLKLFLTRFDEDSKVILTGDPTQSDLYGKDVALVEVMNRLEAIPGIGMVTFKNDSIVRHRLLAKIIEKLDE